MNNESNESQKRAEVVLWDLPLNRKEIYPCLRDFVRWALDRQGPTLLEQFEKDLADFENHLRASVEMGALSEEQANESRGNHIWYIARKVSRDLPQTLALWGLPPITPFDDAEFERALDERRNLIEAEFSEKLKQCLNTGEV